MRVLFDIGGIGQCVPGRRAVAEFVASGIGFIDDFALEQDGILGGKCLRRIDRKLCPGLDCHFCCHSVNSFRGLNIG